MTGKKFPHQLIIAADHDIEAEKYWLDKLAGEPGKSYFFYDYKKKAKYQRAFDLETIKLTGQLFNRLQELSSGSDLRVFISLVTGLAILMSRYTHNHDITLGTSIYRQTKESDFINTVLPIRNRVNTNRTFKELVMQVGNSIFEANQHRNYPIERLLQLLDIGYSENEDFPLFDVAVLLNPLHHRKFLRHIHLNIIFMFTKTGDTLELTVEYNSSLYKKSTIRRIVSSLSQVLNKAVFNVELPVREIDVLGEQEKKKILYDFNNTETGYSRDKTLHQLFQDQVEKKPVSTAVTFDGKALNYRDLNIKANQLARELKQKGIHTNHFVAVVMDRSIEMVIGVMAVLKAGGAYVPLEPHLPEARLITCLSSLNVKCLLTDGLQLSKISKLSEQLPWLQHIFCLDELPNSKHSWEKRFKSKTLVRKEEIETNPTVNLPLAATAADIAYVIFTSGTTGMPKGVVEPHRPVVNIIEWVNTTFRVGSPDRLLFVASLSFDLSVYDIFGILACGASLRVAASNDIKSPKRLLEIIIKESITFWDSAPAALQLLVSYLQDLPVPANTRESQLRLVFLSGDWIPLTLPPAMKEAFPGAAVISLGGATEATIWSNFYPVEHIDPDWNSIPYGKPTQNAKYYILDPQLQPCPIGVPGNLYIGGECLSSGYINFIELTAEKFIDNPFIPGEKIYRTGDMAQWFPDGNIEFLGRQDTQVKIRGFRVELGEIQTRLLTHNNIKEAVVTVKNDTNGDKYLAAYYVPDNNDKHIASSQLRQYLSRVLPGYMIPSYFIPMTGMPVTSNGKLDRKALPEPVVEPVAECYMPPQDEVEEKIVEIWAHVLGIEKKKIGTQHNFFDLGGQSINLVMVVSNIYKELGVEVPVAQTFENPVIIEMAKFVKSKKAVEEPVVILNQLNQSTSNIVFCFPPGIGFGIAYKGLAELLKDVSLYSFNFIEEEDRLKKYADIITAVQPQGPYIFFGYSAGGLLIFHVVKELEKQGRETSDIILADSFWNIDNTEKFVREEKEFVNRVQVNLEQLGMDFLKDRVKTKIEKYLDYYLTGNPGVIHANVHLILSQQYKDSDKARCWEEFTTKDLCLYQGFGEHEEMFTPGPLEKNAGLLRKILESLDFDIEGENDKRKR